MDGEYRRTGNSCNRRGRFRRCVKPAPVVLQKQSPASREPYFTRRRTRMLPPSSSSEHPGGSVISQAQLKRERLRFTNFVFHRAPSGTCRSEVELEWLEGERVTGKAEGVTSTLGDLRVAADAALRAIERFSDGTLRFELVGVKTMRAFDANIVIVSVIGAHGGGPQQRLLGCHLAEDDPLRSAVVAVLHATNRVLGNFIATR
jgi:hypothetical protein